MKVIKTDLSTDSINKLIRKLKDVQKNLKDCETEITKELVTKGVNLIQENYTNTTERPFDEDYTVITDIQGNKGKAIAQGSSVIYMEFGTGELGERGVNHPKRNDFALKDFNSGKYIKTHSIKDNATENRIAKNGQHYWFYHKKYTQGIPAGLQVYNASEKLKKEKINISRKVVKDKVWKHL